MQKVMMLFTICLGAGFVACAQKAPPAAIITAFNQKFQNISDIDWEHERNGEWEAEFEQGDTEMSANFSADGKWLETETEIKFADLPAPVQAALQGKKVKEAARILRVDGSTVYEAEVKRKDLLFDVAGKMLPADKD